MAKAENEIFARNLKEILTKSPYNQKKLAAELGISGGTMSDYINATAYPRPERLAKLCKILGVSQYDLTTDHFAEDGEFIPNRDLLCIAKEIYDNPEARFIFTALKSLDADTTQAIRTLIYKLSCK